MITRTKQTWEPGRTVKVGFLTLHVVEKIPTPGDWMPDAYVLTGNGRYYRFVPHNGLTRCVSLAEARQN